MKDTSNNNDTFYLEPIGRVISADATFCDDLPNVVPERITREEAIRLASMVNKGELTYQYFLLQSAMDAGIGR